MSINISGKKFQVKLLVLSIKNSTFLRKYRHALNPEWFEFSELKMLAELIFAYYDQYHEPPSFDTLEFLVSGLEEHLNGDPEEWKKLIRMLEMQGDDGLQYVYDHVSEFVQYRAYKEAILLGARMLEEGKYDEIPQIVRDAQKWDKSSIPYVNFFESLSDWLEKEEIREVIPTGISDLDDILEGGTARGELSIVLAVTNTGKTMLLVNFGAGALLSGKKVYHFHTEQKSDVIMARYVARLSGIPYKQLKDDKQRTEAALRRIQNKTGSELLISKCSGYRIEALRSFIYKHGQPDVVIIDYADELVPSKSYRDKWNEISLIYTEMINMAEEFNCSIYTASQTNRQAVGKEKVTIKDFAESYDKANKADNIFAICATEEEQAMNTLRLFMAKIRNVEKGNTEIECKMIPNLMRILSASEYTSGRI